jgi:putative ABC transport system permease protein
MRILDYFRSLKHTFALNRMRSALTLLGIIIGTGSIVALAGLLQGAERALMKVHNGVNESDTVRILRDEVPRKDAERPKRDLSREDGAELDESLQLDGFDVISESRQESKALHRGREKRVRLVGGRARTLEMYRLKMDFGRFIDETDLQDGKRVAVLGHEVWKELLKKDPDVLGTQITIDDNNFTVVGVLQHKAFMGHGDGTWMWDRRVVIPQTAFDAEFTPEHKIHSIYLRARTERPTDQYMTMMGSLAEQLVLRRHHGVKNFTIEDRKGGQQEKLIINIIQILLLGTGLMSMFVGGINIMNIMLVTVTERTREIGIRRALGASPRAIMTQFVMEAGAVSLVGGILGVFGGIAFSWLVGLALTNVFGGWSFHVEIWSVGLGLALAMLTGVTFGFFPAWRASGLNAVDALRHE